MDTLQPQRWKWVTAVIIFILVTLFIIIVIIVLLRKKKVRIENSEPIIAPIRPPIVPVLPPLTPTTPVTSGPVTLMPTAGDIVFSATPQNGDIVLNIPGSTLYTIGSRIRIFNTSPIGATSGNIIVVAGSNATINQRFAPQTSTTLITRVVPIPVSGVIIRPGDVLVLTVTNNAPQMTTFLILPRVDPTIYVFIGTGLGGIANPVLAANLITESVSTGVSVQYILGTTYIFFDPASGQEYRAPVTFSGGTATFLNQNGVLVRVTI